MCSLGDSNRLRCSKNSKHYSRSDRRAKDTRCPFLKADSGIVLFDIFFVIQLCCEIQQNNYCDYADYQRSQHTALVVEVRTVEAVGHII
jgi:hypothetical protein